MIIVNAILYLSSAWYKMLSFNQFFVIILLIDLLRKITKIIEHVIFPSIAENQENMIFFHAVIKSSLLVMITYNPVRKYLF